MSTPVTSPGLRYLVVRGRSTSLRYALPALGSVSVGSGAENDLRVREPDVAREHAVIFLDHGIGLRALEAPSALVLGDRSGRPDAPPKEKAIAAGQTVELELGARVRLGSIELAFAAAEEPPPAVHAVGRAFLEKRLASDALAAQAEGGAVTLMVLRVSHLAPDPVEEALGQQLEPTHVVARLADDEWAVLLGRVSESRAQEAVASVARALADRGAEVFAGLADTSEVEARDLVETAGDRLARPALLGQRGRLVASKDAAMQAVERLIEKVAKSSTHVLVLGETGVGKDVVAQSIHERSARAAGPFIRVNCVDLSDSFLEEAATNFLSRARGGTVHLDEVAGLSPRAQLSLGYLLDESPSTGHDVRFLASSNQDLSAHVASGAFRKDLYFRLNQVTIAVPPLRARVADVVPLAEHFLARAAESHGRAKAPAIATEAKVALEGYAWPGNIRELKNVVERALLLASGDLIGVEHLPREVNEGGGDVPALRGALAAGAGLAREEPLDGGEDDDGGAAGSGSGAGAAGKPGSLREEIAALEKKRIIEALQKYPTQRDAAASLDMPMRTFLNRLDALGIPRARGGGQKSGGGGSAG